MAIESNGQYFIYLQGMVLPQGKEDVKMHKRMHKIPVRLEKVSESV